eukprot:2030469-Prymnesium_polylepis.1
MRGSCGLCVPVRVCPCRSVLPRALRCWCEVNKHGPTRAMRRRQDRRDRQCTMGRAHCVRAVDRYATHPPRTDCDHVPAQFPSSHLSSRWQVQTGDGEAEASASAAVLRAVLRSTKLTRSWAGWARHGQPRDPPQPSRRPERTRAAGGRECAARLCTSAVAPSVHWRAVQPAGR